MTKLTIFDDGAVGILADALDILFNTEELMEVDEDRAGAGDPTPVHVARYSLAMISEVDEYAKELQWKPWKLRRPVDPDRVVDEFADILAFEGILFGYGLRATGLSPLDFAKGFLLKSQVNIERINEGKHGYGGAKFHPDELVVPGPQSVFRAAIEAGTATLRDLPSGSVIRTLSQHLGAVGDLVVGEAYELTHDGEFYPSVELLRYNGHTGVATFKAPLGEVHVTTWAGRWSAIRL